MRIRKSGLGGHYCQLSGGKTLYLTNCAECGSLLLKDRPRRLGLDKESLDELHESGVRDWSGLTYLSDELLCSECGKREEYKEIDYPIGVPYAGG